jgi:leader peptidase (prepilin peptidase)/N-methyltransferase
VLPFASFDSLLPLGGSQPPPRLLKGQFRHKKSIVTAQTLASSTATVPLWVVFVIAGAIGLLVGSFLNVVVYRVPRGLSVSKPRSFCPTCQRQLAWWENVPVVSWVALRGRCRTCHEPISVRYPLVEGGTAAAFVLIAWARHGSLMTIPYCLLAATIISILLIDAGELRSPLLVAALGTAAGDVALVAVAAAGKHWWVLVGGQIGTLAGVVVFSALRQTDPECRRTKGFGRGALIPAGCWLGGLGLVPAGIGAGAFVAVFLVAVLLDRSRPSSAGPTALDSAASSIRGVLRHLIGLPMIASVALAAIAGLIAFAQ